ncbi:MAG: cytochrome d ubiquinol oxidase subunit II, partial [Steroidobacteraceae bacterium]
MAIDLVPVWAVLLAFGVFMYVLLDGFDLGVGILFPLAPDDRGRDLMMASVGPIWDGNETWLVFGGLALFAAFPLAFAVIIPALYFPILAMVLGLVFRGVAFEFRQGALGNRKLWGWAFFGGSLMATFAQGCVLGKFVRGFAVAGRQYAGTSWDWLHPFVIAVGVGLVFGYLLLGATWLVMKTEGTLQDWARAQARIGLWGTLAFIAVVSLCTPLFDARIAERWFTWPNLAFLAPVPIATAAIAWWLWSSLRLRREVAPFIAAIGLFLLCYLGLAISLFPHIVPPTITLW